MTARPYDLIVIGGGAAGLTSAGFMGKVGGRVALIEREHLGGDCTWAGCVPSKALLKVGKMAQTVREAAKYGITTSPPQVDMAAVRAYVQATIDEIYQHETPEVFGKNYNVEVIIGEARFVDPHTVAVGDRRLSAKKVIIATGARPTIPPIDGLADVAYKTNRNIFDNDRLPERLLVIGAGPIGVEMAQAHARLGAEVVLIDERLLPRDEPEVAEVIQPILAREGVRFVSGLVAAAQQGGERDITLTLKDGQTFTGDMLLVAVGRTPNTALDLEKAGVDYAPDGVIVDKFLRTSARHIYAVGDCTQGPKFTHYAGFQASIAGRNATLPFINSNGHDENVPWVTFTDPEIAHVGLTEAQARERHGDKVKVRHFSLRDGDRTLIEGDAEGFIKMVYLGGGRLIGATVVSQRAGEMIFEFLLAVKGKISLSGLVGLMHPYPSYSDVVKKAASGLVIDELFKGVSGWGVRLLGRLLFKTK